ncbi:MAG: DUF397 domain-containing protein [Streptosporangiales bacterium]|nr:DUF397 domain-containing protein [Streptosporangiales bacterium]
MATYSAGEGNCVEVGASGDTVLVRDTKDRAAGSLWISSGTWRRFAAEVKTTDRPARPAGIR